MHRSQRAARSFVRGLEIRLYIRYLLAAHYAHALWKMYFMQYELSVPEVLVWIN
jgi:hypothetical protein